MASTTSSPPPSNAGTAAESNAAARPRSVLRLPEIHAQRAQLAIQVRALHADALRELADLAAAELQLLREVGALEVLARLAQRQRRAGPASPAARRPARCDAISRSISSSRISSVPPWISSAVHQVLQLADVARPRVVAQPVLRRDAEAAERQALVVDQAVDVVAQQVGHVLGVVAQRRHAQRQHVQVRQQVAAGTARGRASRSRAGPNRSRARRSGPASSRPARRKLPVSSAANSSRCAAGGRSPSSLMNSTPRSACSSRPLRTVPPVLRAVQHRLERPRRVSAPADDRDERPVRARAERVDVAGEGLAARARLADDQHRRLVRRELLHLLAQLAHQPAAPDGREQRREQRCARPACGGPPSSSALRTVRSSLASDSGFST